MKNNDSSLNLEDWESFATISLASYNLQGLDIDPKLALNALVKELQGDFTSLNQEKTKIARCNYFKIPNTTKDHYAEHLINVTNDKLMIAGIRHYGRTGLAFLHILTNFKTSKQELLTIYQEKLQPYFAPFQPKYLRYYTPQEIASDMAGGCDMVKRASVIKKNTAFEAEKELELNNPENEEYYDWYVSIYKAFHAQNPDLAAKIPFNDKGIMEESRQSGLLKTVFYRKERIGLIAAIASEFLGHKGIYFIDLLLKEQWKGQGLAKAMQRKYIDEVVVTDAIVWGIIDVANKPSLHTAKALGRQEVRYENFIRIGSVIPTQTTPLKPLG